MYYFFANEIASAEQEAIVAACKAAHTDPADKDRIMIYASSAYAAWGRADRLKEYNAACSRINFFRRKIKELRSDIASLI